MDSQMMFNVGISLIFFLGGWTLNRIYQAIDKLDKDVRDMPHTYVSKDDYKSDLTDIKNLLNKIFDRLDTKADKPK
mgnify:CR=1 FL=1|tara:strand:+ start:3727 stop:3954 length:228 start_codon:yes stop_codon:yes gene_type:complete